VAHFKLFFRTSVRSCRQRMTLNTLSLLAAAVAVVKHRMTPALVAAVREDT
jgi:hypothetical protein